MVIAYHLGQVERLVWAFEAVADSDFAVASFLTVRLLSFSWGSMNLSFAACHRFC